MEFSVPLSTVLNGQQEYCYVSLNDSEVDLKLRHLNFKLGFRVQLNQRNIDRLLHLLMMIKMCNGLDSIHNESSVLVVKQVSVLGQSNEAKLKTWSSTCKVMLNWASKKIVVTHA